MNWLRVVLAAMVCSTGAFAQTTGPARQRPKDVVAGWKAAADPAKLKGRPRFDINTSIPLKRDIKAVVSNRPSHSILLIDDDHFNAKVCSLLNLATGGATPAFTQKFQLDQPLLSADGQILATKVRGERGGPASIDLIAVKGGAVLQKIPSDDKFGAPDPVGFTADRLIAFTSSGFKPRFVAYDIKGGAKAWESESAKGMEGKFTAISPGGKFVAGIGENRLIVIETSKGETAAALDLPKASENAPFGSKPKGMAFSPDGLELATYCEHGMGKSRLLIWDMATGQVMTDQVAEMPKDDRWARHDAVKFEYFADGNLLRFSNHVIDRETGKSIWTIPGSRNGKADELIVALGSDRVLMVSEKDKDRAWISVAALPKDQIAKAMTVVRSGGKSSDASLPPLSKGDWTGAKVLLDAAAPQGWTLKADAGTGPAYSSPGAIALRRESAPGKELSAKTVIFSGRPANQAAVAYHSQDKKTIVDRLAVGAGSAAGSVEFPAHADLLDFSADGRFVVLRTGEERLDIYTFAPAAKHVIGFRPYEEEKDAKQVRFAAMVTPDQLVTVSRTGRLALWQIVGAAPKVIYEITAKSEGFALSPGRKQLAWASGSGFTLIDVATGQIIAGINGNETTSHHLAFSPDGTRLVNFSAGPFPFLTAWELNTGKTLGETAVQKSAWPGPVSWAGPDHLLVHDLLVNLDKKVVVWRYVAEPFSPKIHSASEPFHWGWVSPAFNTNQPPALVAVTLPHDDAKKASAQLAAGTNLVVKPGMKISIEANVVGDDNFRKSVIDALTQRATHAGLTVAEGQNLRLVATTSEKESRTVEYRIIRFGGGGPAQESATIPSYECKLELIADGQTVWDVSTLAGGYAPSFTGQLKEGESVQDLVNRQNANPGGNFYKGVPIPGTVAKPAENLGASKITLKGLVKQAVNQP